MWFCFCSPANSWLGLWEAERQGFQSHRKFILFTRMNTDEAGMFVCRKPSELSDGAAHAVDSHDGSGAGMNFQSQLTILTQGVENSSLCPTTTPKWVNKPRAMQHTCIIHMWNILRQVPSSLGSTKTRFQVSCFPFYLLIFWQFWTARWFALHVGLTFDRK